MGSLKALVITPKYGGADAHTLGGWFLGLFLVFGPFLNSESQVSSSKAGEILRDSDGNINATTFCFLQWNKRSEARAWSFLWGRDSGKAPSCGCLLFSTGFLHSYLRMPRAWQAPNARGTGRPGIVARHASKLLVVALLPWEAMPGNWINWIWKRWCYSFASFFFEHGSEFDLFKNGSV